MAFLRWRSSYTSMALRLLLACCTLALASASYPDARPYKHSHYGSKKNEFMPAEPGEKPSCLNDPRLTYCLDPDDYPKGRILYLLQNNMFNMSTFVMDETRDTYTFEAKDVPPPSNSYLPPMGYPPPVHDHYSKPARHQSVSKYGQSSINAHRGYGSTMMYNTSSSYAYYHKQHPEPSMPYGRSLPSTSHYVYNRPASYSYRDYSATAYRHKYRQSRQPSRYEGPRVSPYKSHSWWRKIPTSSRRYKRQVFGAEQDEDSVLCPTRSAYISPRAAQSTKGDWMFLVNLDDDPSCTQLVRSETCIRNECSGSCRSTPGARAVCQQQFVQKRLVALDGSGQRLNQDVFWFPSCCICKIRN